MKLRTAAPTAIASKESQSAPLKSLEHVCYYQGTHLSRCLQLTAGTGSEGSFSTRKITSLPCMQPAVFDL